MKVKTVAGFAPLNLPNITLDAAQKLITNHLLNPKEFATPYPIPSTSIDEPGFSATSRLVWRGPSWISTNWYCCKGLFTQKDHIDTTKCLENIISQTEKMVYNSNFWEIL